MKIIKTVMPVLLALLLNSCDFLMEGNYFINMRVENNSSENLYEVNLENLNLGSMARSAQSQYYSVRASIDSVSIKHTPYSEWEVCHFYEYYDEDGYYTLTIYDDDTDWNGFDVRVYEDYYPTAAPSPVPTSTPSQQDPYFVIEMDVDGVPWTFEDESFFEYNSEKDMFELAISDEDLNFISIELPSTIYSDKIFSGNNSSLPENFDIIINLGDIAHTYYIDSRDVYFKVSHWDYIDQEITAIFSGSFYSILQQKYVEITNGVIVKINP